MPWHTQYDFIFMHSPHSIIIHPCVKTNVYKFVTKYTIIINEQICLQQMTCKQVSLLCLHYHSTHCYLQIHGVKHVVKHQRDEGGNLLLPLLIDFSPVSLHEKTTPLGTLVYFSIVEGRKGFI